MIIFHQGPMTVVLCKYIFVDIVPYNFYIGLFELYWPKPVSPKTIEFMVMHKCAWSLSQFFYVGYIFCSFLNVVKIEHTKCCRRFSPIYESHFLLYDDFYLRQLICHYPLLMHKYTWTDNRNSIDSIEFLGHDVSDNINISSNIVIFCDNTLKMR